MYSHYCFALLFALIAGGDLYADSAKLVHAQTVRTENATSVIGPSNSKLGPGTEGASVDERGTLHVVDIFGVNTLAEINIATQTAELFYRDPDNTTSISGSRFVSPKKGETARFLFTDYKNHRVIEVGRTGKFSNSSMDGTNRQIVCSDPQMLQPNDIAISNDEKFIYLSGMRVTDAGEASGDLWVCQRNQNAKAIRLDNFPGGRTNGIEISPSGTTLYLSEAVGGWTPNASRIWRYTLDAATGRPTGPRSLFVDFGKLDNSSTIDIDGMRTDTSGNLYVTRNGAGAVVQLSPSGQLLKRISTTFVNAANLELGGPDGKELYIVGPCPVNTSKDAAKVGCIDKYRTDTPGRAWTSLKHSGNPVTPKTY